MRYEDMTTREQRLLRASVCPFCHEHLEQIEDVQILKIKYGKRVIPFYIHTACLLNSLLIPSQLEEVKNEETK